MQRGRLVAGVSGILFLSSAPATMLLQPCTCPLQEEEPIDAAWLGRELGCRPTEEGSTFRVLHAQLAKADAKLKVWRVRCCGAGLAAALESCVGRPTTAAALACRAVSAEFLCIASMLQATLL